MNVCGTFFCLVCCIHTCRGAIKFGIYAEFLVGECAENVGSIAFNVSDLTHINVNLEVIRPELICVPICFCGITVDVNIGIIIDYSNGQCCKCYCSGLSIITCTGNNDGSSIVFFINRIGSGKSVSQYHMIEFKMVTVVQIDNSLYRLNGFDLVCVHVHPINGTAVKFIKSRVCGNNFNSRSVNIGLNFDKSDYNRLVAHIIANFKFNTVDTVCNSYIADGHFAVCESNRNFNAINIRLGRRVVKAGSIGLGSILCNLCRYGEKVAGGYSSFVLIENGGKIVARKLYCAKNRSFSVINCIGEVCGDIINIYSLETVDSAIFLPKIISVCVREHKLNETEVIGIIFRSVVADYILAIKAGNKNLAVRANVNREIFPAGLIPRIINLRLIDNGNCVLLIKFTVVIGIIPIKNTNPAVLVFIWNISPEADGFCIFYYNAVIKEQVTLTITTGRNIISGNRVHFNSHGADTVMNLSVFGSSKAEVLVEALIITIYIGNVPAIDIGSIFKIEKNLGALTKAKGCCCNELCIMYKSSSKCAREISGSIFLADRSELEAVKCTESGVGCNKSNVFGLKYYRVKTTVNSCVQTDCYFLVKRNCHYCL